MINAKKSELKIPGKYNSKNYFLYLIARNYQIIYKFKKKVFCNPLKMELGAKFEIDAKNPFQIYKQSNKQRELNKNMLNRSIANKKCFNSTFYKLN